MLRCMLGATISSQPPLIRRLRAKADPGRALEADSRLMISARNGYLVQVLPSPEERKSPTRHNEQHVEIFQSSKLSFIS